MTKLEINAPIQRRSLHDELVERLTKLITDGELPAGQRIPEADLCERFGVSRTPLREALKVLAAEGLVVLTPNRGASVTTITQGDLEEAFPIMAVLEGFAGELAATRATPTQIATITTLHTAMRGAFQDENYTEYRRLNATIHEAILLACGNNVLIQQYQQLASRVRRVRYVAKMSPSDWQKSMDEHEAILDALTARDGERLSRVLREHVLGKVSMVTAWMREQHAN